MGKRPPREPIKPVNMFKCPNCEGEPEFDGVLLFKEHLASAHSISETEGIRTPMVHLDFSDHYSQTYEWALGGLRFLQLVVRLKKERK